MRAHSRNPHEPYAVVLGLDHNIIGLQTARILAHRGVPVIAIARDPTHWACRTNACERIVFGRTDLLGALADVGATLEAKAVLYPCTDEHVLLASRNRDRLAPWYHVALPPADVLEMLIDKVRFYTFAQEAGFPIPPTVVVHGRQDLERAADTLTFPCALKPPSKSSEWRQRTRQKAIKVASAKELLHLYEQFADFPSALIVQSWIDGTESDLYSCNCYFDRDSRPLVSFVARKLRQWPPRTGQSSLGEECRNDTVLHDTLRLFRTVGLRGLGYVEMKFDPRRGEHFIVEPNIGRPTGRSAIAEAGGVELLYTMYSDIVGRPLPPNREQQYTGAKWVDIRRGFAIGAPCLAPGRAESRPVETVMAGLTARRDLPVE